MIRNPLFAPVAVVLISIGVPAAAQDPVVNAPVAPEAIYIGLGAAPGSDGGVSVIDLNGFGQGTGDLATSNLINNPNVGVVGPIPTIQLGTSSRDAGGAGPFTLTQDTNGGTNLTSTTTLGRVVDLQIGQPLDKLLNNANININANSGNQINPFTGSTLPGNTISIAPHPNPPRLLPSSPNPLFNIEGEEPTTTSSFGPPGAITTANPPCFPVPPNQLTRLTGLIGGAMPGVFYGPQPAPASPPPPPPFCPFTSRQQIGHFLYALHENFGQISVFDSNRFRLITRLGGPGFSDIAISPNLKWLAASRSGSTGSSGAVAIFDIDPMSLTFHQQVASVSLTNGIGPLAWQPETEDLLVVNPTNGTLFLVDPSNGFATRRTITNLSLVGARRVIAMPRETGSGLYNGVYLAYILNGADEVVVYESGPSNLGFDDLIGTVGQTFPNATTMQPIISIAGDAGFWIGHQDSGGLGVVQRIELFGQRGTQSTTGQQPNLRGKQWTSVLRVGGFNPGAPASPLLSGNDVVDIAYDDTINAGALPDFVFPGPPPASSADHSGKGLIKSAFGTPIPATFPQFLFIALGDTDRVDVFVIQTGARFTSIQVPGGVRSLAHYWRQ